MPKFRIATWNPDDEGAKFIGTYEEEDVNEALSKHCFQHIDELSGGEWDYMTACCFASMLRERTPINEETTRHIMAGGQVKMSANDDDYTCYLIERIE